MALSSKRGIGITAVGAVFIAAGVIFLATGNTAIGIAMLAMGIIFISIGTAAPQGRRAQ
jgi:hypothetical protein